MNAPLIARPTVRLTIAKGLVVDLAMLSDEAYQRFVEAKGYAEAALPELLAAGAAAGAALALFVVDSGDTQLLIEFDARTEVLRDHGLQDRGFRSAARPGCTATARHGACPDAIRPPALACR